MKIVLKFLTINALCAVSLLAHSENTPTSADRQPLGRFFMSVDERQRLDVQRAAPPVTNGSAPQAVSNSDSPVRKQKPAAGYIIGPSGMRSAWSDGEFRPVERPSALQRMRFPGTIMIEVRESQPVSESESSPDTRASEKDPGAAMSTPSVSSDDTVQP